MKKTLVYALSGGEMGLATPTFCSSFRRQDSRKEEFGSSWQSLLLSSARTSRY